MPPSPLTPDRLLLSDPVRLRDLATWLDRSGSPVMAAGARRAARDLDGWTAGRRPIDSEWPAGPAALAHSLQPLS
ncbi:MAG TPA: hypothetical protein VF576_07515 [Rubricoccaceae bacterium]